MDLLKEILITFSSKKKKEFEKFLVRKRPSDDRRDIKVLVSYLHILIGLAKLI